jgi:tRNA pseudouridine13 synthase
VATARLQAHATNKTIIFLKIYGFQLFMHKIKEVPEDFVVDEIFPIKTLEKGEYSIFKLTKKNRNTDDIIKVLVDRLHIKRKNIGYAGIKDKKAITSQYISIFKVKPEKVKQIDFIDASLGFIGSANEPITLGSHTGNKFKITIRNVDINPKTHLQSIPNYFDEQRFSKKNAEIGKCIVKKDFKKAAELVLQTNPVFQDKMREFLDSHNNDHIGALRIIPKKRLLLYIHAYQSLLFNRILSNYLSNKKIPCKKVEYSQGEFLFPEKEFFEQKKAPLIGFGTEIKNHGTSEIIKEVMKKEKIELRDFIFQKLPEFSQEGEERDMFVKVDNLQVSELEDDDLNPEKKKLTIEFSLQKASYATMVIRALFC